MAKKNIFTEGRIVNSRNKTARTLYLWVAYADDEVGTGISLYPEGKYYMGTSPNHTKETPDISDPSIYKWQKISGKDGRGILYKNTYFALSKSNKTAPPENGINILDLTDYLHAEEEMEESYIISVTPDSIDLYAINPQAHSWESVTLNSIITVGKTYNISYNSTGTYDSIGIDESTDSSFTERTKINVDSITIQDGYYYRLKIYYNTSDQNLTETYVNSYTNVQLIEIGESEWTEEPLTTTEEYKYLWSYEETTYTDGTIEKSAARVIGTHGVNGEDGRSEVSNVTEYYLSTSSAELTGGTWSEQMPEWESGKYIWKRNKITWSDGTVTYTDPVLDTALNHANEAADYATGKAEEAATAAGNAQASATIAQEQAELSAQASANAQESANTANTNAADAINKANAAQEAADEANEQVTIINGEISTIKEDQTDIRNEMSAEITTIKETMEASYAKKTDVSDTEMELRAEISKSAAEIQTTMESDYAKKTELTDVQSSLQTQITQNAQEISSTASAVETVQIDATDAKNKANEAVQTATEAQNTAQTAVSAAQDAQESADAATLAAQTAQSEATKAQTEADTAKQAAEDAKAVADAAQTDLDAAKQNLTNVTNRVDATEEEIAAAQAAVDAAQQKADEANASAAEAQAAADAAQASADTAKQNAATAQATADTAKQNAAAAQTAADEAKAEADKANAAVGNLANTVTDMQTQISQNAEEIELAATKTEVQEYLSGYSTKEETESAINLASASIRAEVNASIGAISGGDNILRGTNVEKELVEDGTWTTGQWKLRGTGTATSYVMTDSPVSSLNIAWTIKGAVYPAKYGGIQQTQITIEPGTYTVSVWAKNTSADSTLSAQLAFYLGNSQIGSTISVGKNWGRYSATFSAETESITIAFYNPSSITSTDICGMTLNKGETASPWTPSTFDIGDDLTAIRASLELKVDKTSLISEINASANVITLTGNRFVVNSDNFSLTQDGTMKATNAEFSGKITSSSGTIGGFTIDADALTYNDDSFYMGLNSYKGIEAYNIVSGAVDNNSRAVLKDGGIYVGSSFGLTTDGTVDWDDYTKHITAVTKDGIFSKKDIVLTENNAGLYGVGAIPSGTIGVAENYHLIGVNADNNVLVGFSATGDAREGNTQIYATNGYVRLIAGNGNAVEEVRLTYNDANGFRFSPTEAGKGLLGSTTYYFNRVYASLAQWTPSDKRKKTNIRKFDERFEKMYDGLEPILYELIESRGQSHFGMIAQDVETIMQKYGIKPEECGFFEYDEENDVYGLIYQELAVYNTWILQKTRQELRELRASL